MTLRPINNKQKTFEKDKGHDSDIESFMDDNIVIVAFPSCLWNSVKDAAEKLEITANEALANAIKEYCNRNDV